MATDRETDDPRRRHLTPYAVLVTGLIVLSVAVLARRPDSRSGHAGPSPARTGAAPGASGSVAPTTADAPPAPAEGAAGAGDARPLSEARRRVAALRARMSEEALRELARRSVAIEDAARAELGESEEAYERMAAEWAELCKSSGITEEERQALEDEAIRASWLPPSKD
ncbi:MAG: hypothetical protein HYZ53_24475 [Planctomycetes bacterium]|nr:hypothetical protein [Planctomycetota bacterium]